MSPRPLNGQVSNSLSTLNKHFLVIFLFKPRYYICIPHMNNFPPSRTLH